ncbi:hypothetical protein HBH69_105770 [Parastagonospora nodorum]|nr:hypothetical protein HBH69_105770 [Parastagonospora nodorum]KAH6042564.1 hypothetical protein HBI54_127280 [Parastagonospora nodorum]
MQQQRSSILHLCIWLLRVLVQSAGQALLLNSHGPSRSSPSFFAPPSSILQYTPFNLFVLAAEWVFAEQILSCAIVSISAIATHEQSNASSSAFNLSHLSRAAIPHVDLTHMRVSRWRQHNLALTARST